MIQTNLIMLMTVKLCEMIKIVTMMLILVDNGYNT